MKIASVFLFGVVLTLFTSTFAGCMSQSMSGATAADEPATLRAYGTSIKAINGEEFSVFSESAILAPGNHVVEALPDNANFLSPGQSEVAYRASFNAEPGGRYIVRTNPSSGLCIWVEDETTHRVVSGRDIECGERLAERAKR